MAGVTSATSSAAAGAGERGAVHTVQERANGEGEDGAELTAIAASVEAGSGKAGAERGDDGDLGGRSWGRRGQGRLQSGRALGARPARRSRRRRSSWTRWHGARTTEGAATTTVRRQGRRPWWERARERGKGVSEVSAGSGRRRGAHPGVQGRGRQAGGAVASSRSSASPLCLPGEDEAAGWHGPAQCWACQVGCGQVSGPGKIPLSLLFIVSVFYYFCICWALLKISRHFQKS